MNALRKSELHGYTVEIHQDEDPGDPRDWTHGAELVFGHRRYDFPNDAGIDFGEFANWTEVTAHLTSHEHALLVLPVYMLDHSGLAFRVAADFGDADPGNWDSGVVGLGYVTRQNWADTQGTEWTGSEADREQAARLIEQDVQAYGQYVNGDVYGYVLKDSDGEVI